MKLLNVKTLAAVILIIVFFVTVSGCEDAYGVLKTYVPTPTPTSQDTIKIGDAAPRSVVKDVTITGQGNTIVIRGRGPYNVETHQDYFALNKGNADISIDLKGSGFGCGISLYYTNPYTGSPDYVPIHQFTSGSRVYSATKQVNVPCACKYCLTVNWGGDWEITIAQ
jgi:hypothetical protein